MHHLIFLTLFFIFSYSSQLQSTVRILTFHYNEPRFLEMQIKTMQKFIEDDYQLFVINDAPSLEVAAEISQICEQYGVTCARYEQEWHDIEPINEKIFGYLNDTEVIDFIGFREWYSLFGNLPGLRHSHVIQYALNSFGLGHDDLVVIFDGDMFPIRPVSIKALQEDYDVIGLYRFWTKVNIGYMWVPFISLNMPLLPHQSDISFYFDVLNGFLGDTGSSFNYFLLNHSNLKVKKYKHSIPYSIDNNCSDDFQLSGWYKHASKEEISRAKLNEFEAELCKNLPDKMDVEFHINHQFLHYRASSYVLFEEKAQLVTDFINKILQ